MLGTQVVLDWPDNYAYLCVYPYSQTYASFVHPLSWFMQGKLGSCALPDAADADPSNLENLVDPQMSNRISLYSSLDLRSGNLFHSQQAGPLGFSYNSLDANDGPLGVGWTHDFNLSLTVNSDGSLCLRGSDGSIACFDKGADNIYRADPRSRDSSIIVKNADGSFTRAAKYGKTYMFDPSGKLVRVADRNGNAVVLTYTGSDLTRVMDGVGRTAKIGVSGGKIVSVTDYSGGVYKITYNSTSGLLASIADPLQNTWSFQYDASKRMVKKTDPSGNETSYGYDASGRLASATSPEGMVKSLSYDSTDNTTRVT